MSDQRTDNLRDQALAYAIESRKSHFEPSVIVEAAQTFYAFLTESLSDKVPSAEDDVTQDRKDIAEKLST